MPSKPPILLPSVVLAELKRARALLETEPEAAHKLALRIGVQSGPDHAATAEIRTEIRRRAIVIADAARQQQRKTMPPPPGSQ